MTRPALADGSLDAVVRFLAGHTGLALSPVRRDHALAGIRRAMERADVRDPARFLDLLERGDAVLDDLVAEVTVGETYFFRDPGHFEAIRTEILPELQRRSPPGRPLRLWSAGCASGEEPYSLAILLDEAGLAGQSRVLGTDISRPALARARDGVYGRWSLRGADAPFLEKFFVRDGERWRLLPRLRQAVEFRFLNLALDAYPSTTSGIWGMDVVLCRNVLIYLDPVTVARVARGLHGALSDGGWLITGPSDPPLADHAPFEAVVLPGGVLYRRAGGAPRPVLRSPGAALFAVEPERAREPVRVDTPAGRPPAVPSPPPPPPPAPTADPLQAARRALATGSYAEVLTLTGGLPADSEAASLRLRALANLRGAVEAAVAADGEARNHPLSVEVHFLHALLLADAGRQADAERAVRRALYLDRSLAVAQFLLGSLLRRRGDLDGARRAYRNVRDLAAAHPAGVPLPLGDGELGERLAAAAASELELLDRPAEVAP